MVFIDAPVIGEELNVWENHLKELEEMLQASPNDQSIKDAIKTAKLTISIMVSQAN
jgi:hypothetical protein